MLKDSLKATPALTNYRALLKYSLLAVLGFIASFELGAKLAGFLLRNYFIPMGGQEKLASLNVSFMHKAISSYYEPILNLLGKPIQDKSLPEYGLLILGAACTTILIAEAGYNLLTSKRTPLISQENFAKGGKNLLKELAFVAGCTVAGSSIIALGNIISYKRSI